MSKHYEEEHEHEMISGEEHEEHEHSEEHEEFHTTGDSDDAAAKKKKKDQMFKLSVVAVAVVVGGGLAAHTFLFKSPPPKARSQFDTPSANGAKPASGFGSSPAQQSQDQQAQAILGGAPGAAMGPTGPTAAPTGSVPVAAGAATATGPTSAAVGLGSATPVALANPITPETATALGAGSASAVAVSGAATTPNGAPVTVVAPVSTAPTAMVAIDAPKDGVERTMSEMSKKMDAIGEALKNFDGAKIERRLVSLEDRMSAMETGSKKPPVKAADKTADKAVASDKPAVVKASDKPHRIHHVARKTSVRKSESTRGESNTLFTQNSVSVAGQKEEGLSAQKSARDYTLQAVIPGRMWIKSEDGVSHTFAVGEKLPDGSKVLKIDADHGRVQTSSGSLQ